MLYSQSEDASCDNNPLLKWDRSRSTCALAKVAFPAYLPAILQHLWSDLEQHDCRLAVPMSSSADPSVGGLV